MITWEPNLKAAKAGKMHSGQLSSVASERVNCSKSFMRTLEYSKGWNIEGSKKTSIKEV